MSAGTQRQMASAIANAHRWAHEPDRTAATAPARAGLQAKFERQVDPDGRLPPAELAKRVDCAKRAHYQRMALASAKARAK